MIDNEIFSAELLFLIESFAEAQNKVNDNVIIIPKLDLALENHQECAPNHIESKITAALKAHKKALKKSKEPKKLLMLLDLTDSADANTKTSNIYKDATVISGIVGKRKDENLALLCLNIHEDNKNIEAYCASPNDSSLQSAITNALQNVFNTLDVESINYQNMILSKDYYEIGRASCRGRV